MKRDEIIQQTLKAMRSEGGLLVSEGTDQESADDYEAHVIATLIDRLPEGEIQTCEDFREFGVSCCGICHDLYAHYDMYIEEFVDGRRAWICCSVRSVLVGSEAAQADLPDCRE